MADRTPTPGETRVFRFRWMPALDKVIEVEARLTDTFALLRRKLWRLYQVPQSAPMVFLTPKPLVQPYPRDPLSKFPEATEPITIWDKAQWGDPPPEIPPEPPGEALDIIHEFSGCVGPPAEAPINVPAIGAAPYAIAEEEEEEEDGGAFGFGAGDGGSTEQLTIAQRIDFVASDDEAAEPL
jgi:hypothetical protein